MALPINSGNVLAQYGTNFDTHPDWKHDLFTMVQAFRPGVSDIMSGKADAYLKRAYTQNYWHTEDRLAAEQENFKEDDPVNNTPGRGYRNYRRMEYDFQPNGSGKSAELDREEAEDKKVYDKKELLDLMRQHVYAMCTTASAYGKDPITQNDYKDQIKLR